MMELVAIAYDGLQAVELIKKYKTRSLDPGYYFYAYLDGIGKMERLRGDS